MGKSRMDSTTQAPGCSTETSGGHVKPATAADVAARAGVSRQTVSRVVNGLTNVTDETRRRVEQAMDELGFRPNYAGKSLRDGSYRSIGICMYNITRMGNVGVLDGIMSAARERDYALTMIEVNKESPYSLCEASRRMVSRPIDGMIINMNRMAPDFDEFRPMPGINTVILSMYAHPLCTTVDSDQYGSAELVVKHLLAHGHTQIRFITGPDGSLASDFRESGWRDTLTRAHVEPAPVLRGDWTADSGYAAGEQIAREVRGGGDKAPTAVFAGNDQMALGVMAALADAGLSVPGDVSVIGIDDALQGVVPHNRLTTVRFDLAKSGRLAFDAAVDGVPGHPEVIRVPGELVRRETVRDIR